MIQYTVVMRDAVMARQQIRRERGAKMRYGTIVIGLLLFLASCSPTGSAEILPTETPNASIAVTAAASSPTPPSLTDEPATNIVFVRLSEVTTSRVLAEIDVGTTAVMEIYADPSVHQITRRPDGSVESVSRRPWSDHNVAEMRVCTSLDAACASEGNWRPFLAEHTIPMEVNWLGPREFWVTAQFQDSDGNTIPGVGDSYGEPSPVVRAAYTVVGVVDESMPMHELPAPVQTAVMATRASFPVQGSVEIADGGCCAGGTAGDVIEVDVAFQAASPFGDVVEMRTMTGGLCFSEEEIVAVDWQPFMTDESFPVNVAINWIGFYVTVQYRDAHGHLSTVYCDDISVEGHPATPAP